MANEILNPEPENQANNQGPIIPGQPSSVGPLIPESVSSSMQQSEVLPEWMRGMVEANSNNQNPTSREGIEPQNHTIQGSGPDDFTLEEGKKLLEIASRFGGRPTYLESGIDERRLEFAKWLVEHERLGK